MKEEAERIVQSRVEELDIGLDLDRHPGIRKRLAKLGSHFEDSLAMADIIRVTYDELKPALGLSDEGPERLMRTAVMHDIGKSGPAGEQNEYHDSVRRLFVKPHRQFNPFIDGRTKTISEFVAEQDVRDPSSTLAALRDMGIEPDQEPMLDFWRRHAGWTYDILNEELGSDLDETMVRVAGSHHILEGQNPAHIDMKEMPAEAQVLESLELIGLMAAVDKYQAFRSRSGLDHRKAIEKLRQLVESHQEITPAIRDRFTAIIDVLERSEAALDEYFQQSP